MSEDFANQETVAHAGPLPDPWSPAGNVIQLSVETNVTREQLHEALDKVLNLSGCAGCGLLGFDVHLLGNDPITSQLQDIQGIKSVKLVSRQG